MEEAQRIRRESTMGLKWIAKRRQMGGWKSVANKLTPMKLETSEPREKHADANPLIPAAR